SLIIRLTNWALLPPAESVSWRKAMSTRASNGSDLRWTASSIQSSARSSSELKKRRSESVIGSTMPASWQTIEPSARQVVRKNSIFVGIGAGAPKYNRARPDLKQDRRVEATELSLLVFERERKPCEIGEDEPTVKVSIHNMLFLTGFGLNQLPMPT